MWESDKSEDGVFVSQVYQDLSLHLDPSDPIIISRKIKSFSYFSVVASNDFRLLVSHPCFFTEYEKFNPIDKLQQFSFEKNSGNCTLRKDNKYNTQSAVILTVFKRNYLTQILPLICNQTMPPSIILIIQNGIYQTVRSSMISSICKQKAVDIHHIWLSNWNSYSYMRHYAPVPSSIHTTILVDDDMFLSPSAFEKGMEVMREEHCIATERGRLIIDNPDGHANWPMVIGKDIEEIQFVDYAFIPLFMDTEWRKSVYKNAPFSRMYGDILFVSLSIYQDHNIMPCVVPKFDFFLRNEDDDVHSTSRKDRGLYNYHYTRIANLWMDKGYIPFEKRSLVVWVVCQTNTIIISHFLNKAYIQEERQLGPLESELEHKHLVPQDEP